MLSEITGIEEIYIACGRSDLRKGIDGLATLVKEKFNLSPFRKNVLFLFCGGRQDRFKGLIWEGDGFVLLYKPKSRVISTQNIIWQEPQVFQEAAYRAL